MGRRKGVEWTRLFESLCPNETGIGALSTCHRGLGHSRSCISLFLPIQYLESLQGAIKMLKVAHGIYLSLGIAMTRSDLGEHVGQGDETRGGFIGSSS